MDNTATAVIDYQNFFLKMVNERTRVIKPVKFKDYTYAKRACDYMEQMIITAIKENEGDIITVPNYKAIKSFKITLMDLIINAVETSGHIEFSCFCGPDFFLEKAIEKSGLDRRLFSQRMVMMIDDENVEVEERFSGMRLVLYKK